MSFDFLSYLLGIVITSIIFTVPHIIDLISRRSSNKQPAEPKFKPMEDVEARVHYTSDKVVEILAEHALKARGIYEPGLYDYSATIFYKDGLESVRIELREHKCNE